MGQTANVVVRCEDVSFDDVSFDRLGAGRFNHSQTRTKTYRNFRVKDNKTPYRQGLESKLHSTGPPHRPG